MSTDIDRKLAIYYHPLFQQIIKSIMNLFQSDGQLTEISLLQFLQFNLKLQKGLLPTFERDNALVSGLNDWVKEVAQCLTYDGMVSTAKCVDVNEHNFETILRREIDEMKIELFQQKQQYVKIMKKMSTHDAFKLLGVRINKEVFSKFMFDLCSTWCQFLDIQLFSYFLLGIYIQVSQGATLQDSQFRNTTQINAVDLGFMQQFEELKANYNRNKKKDLRYYRAWCEWNYLRVNQIGQTLIMELDSVHHDDDRILQIALIFQQAIKVINEEITNQNPNQNFKAQETLKTVKEKEDKEKDFLIMKKMVINPNSKSNQNIEINLNENVVKEKNQNAQIQQEQEIVLQQAQHQFQIEIDSDGNMYLKKIVKLPIIGKAIYPQIFSNKQIVKKAYLKRKKQECRAFSNLYRKMEAMKIRLQHTTTHDHYAFRKDPKIEERDQFYLKQMKNKQINMVDKIHEKIEQKNLSKANEKQQQNKMKQKRKSIPVESIRKNSNYIHQIMAPSFLSDSNNNIEFMTHQGRIYGSDVGCEKRNLKIGLPKIQYMDRQIKPMKSYHLVGKSINNRDKIIQKIKSISTHQSSTQNALQKLKQQNQHVWSRYLNKSEVQQMTNYQQFYQKLQFAKRKFGQDFESQYRKNFKPMLLYDNCRHELGGIITLKDQQRFYKRMERILKKDEKKKNRRKRKQKIRKYKSIFKNRNQKSLYEQIFIDYHRQAVKELKNNTYIKY